MEETGLQISYDEIKEYIKNLEFKKGVRGIKEDEVFSAIQRIDELYRRKIDGIASEYEAANEKLAAVQQQLELEKSAREIAEERLAAIEASARDYETKASQMTRMMEDIQSMRDSLLEKTRQETEEMLRLAEEKRERLEERLLQEQRELDGIRKAHARELRELEEMFADICLRAGDASDTIGKTLSEMDVDDDDDSEPPASGSAGGGADKPMPAESESAPAEPEHEEEPEIFEPELPSAEPSPAVVVRGERAPGRSYDVLKKAASTFQTLNSLRKTLSLVFLG